MRCNCPMFIGLSPKKGRRIPNERQVACGGSIADPVRDVACINKHDQGDRMVCTRLSVRWCGNRPQLCGIPGELQCQKLAYWDDLEGEIVSRQSLGISRFSRDCQSWDQPYWPGPTVCPEQLLALWDKLASSTMVCFGDDNLPSPIFFGLIPEWLISPTQ